MLVGSRQPDKPGVCGCLTWEEKESLHQESRDARYEPDEEDQKHLQDELGGKSIET